jgi:hypothetical protein
MSSEITYRQDPDPKPAAVREQDIETAFIEKLRDLKYADRPDIRDRAALEATFNKVFLGLREKYKFVLHTPTPASAQNPTSAPSATP